MPDGSTKARSPNESASTDEEKMKLTAVLACLFLTSACSAPTIYTESADQIRIKFGGGGFLDEKARTYIKFRESGKNVVIDGQVISADAFFSFSVPGACYTKNAIFSPHAASYLGLVPARTETLTLAHMLPTPLRDWFKGNIAYYDWVGFAYLEYAELQKIWPEGACAIDGRDAGTRTAETADKELRILAMRRLEGPVWAVGSMPGQEFQADSQADKR